MLKIPLKIGKEEYHTIDKFEVLNIKNKKIAECSIAPGLQIDLAQSALRKCTNPLKNINITKIVDIFKKAAEFFVGTLNVGGCELSFEEHIELVIESTGLSKKHVKEGEAVICYYFKNIENILKAQSPDGSLESYDQGYYNNAYSKNIGWIREDETLSVVLPSNSPTIHTIWMTAIAMKYQVILKPSLEDLITPLRIIEALSKAGFPMDNISFLPTKHENVYKILKSTSKQIIFGSREIIEEFRKYFPYAKYYGPGSSKLLVDNVNDDFLQERIVKHAIEGILSYGGRGCVSLSSVITRKHGMDFANEIAKKLSEIEVYPLQSEEAVIPVIKDEKLCNGLIKYVEIMEQKGAINVSKNFYDNPVIKRDGANFLLPIVLYMNSEHPMFGAELPFPFVTITEENDLDKAKSLLKNSLSVSLLSNSKELYHDLLLEPTILMLYQGFQKNVYHVDPEKPFEGYISSYLYTVKTI